MSVSRRAASAPASHPRVSLPDQAHPESYLSLRRSKVSRTSYFPSFVMGTPITNLAQANNTWSVIDNLSVVRGEHTLKAGLQVSLEQVNVNPNPTFNGSFLFTGTETGSEFADFLIGVASNYNQADSQTYYGRHKYAAGFAQDSWRIGQNLTVNYGVRWDLMQYWSEKYNQIPDVLIGPTIEGLSHGADRPRLSH